MLDYHIHSDHSVDAIDSMATMVRRGHQLGLREMGFSDHLDMNPADQGYGALDLKRCLAEARALAACSPGPVIRAGVEVGEPHRYPQQVAQQLAGSAVDFVIGGVHWVDDYQVGSDSYFARYADPVDAYLREVLEMAETGDLDIVAHLDFPTRYMASWGEYWDPETSRSLLEAVLDTIIGRNLALEVNTASYRRGLDRPHPPGTVLAWYRDRGGTALTMGSDAHSARVLGSGLPEALDLLLELGFESVCGYRDRRCYPLPLPAPGDV